MAIKDALLPEFDHEMATTRRLLERVPEAEFAWKPHAKSMALGQLAGHIANLPLPAAAAGAGGLAISADGLTLVPQRTTFATASLGVTLHAWRLGNGAVASELLRRQLRYRVRVVDRAQLGPLRPDR